MFVVCTIKLVSLFFSSVAFSLFSTFFCLKSMSWEMNAENICVYVYYVEKLKMFYILWSKVDRGRGVREQEKNYWFSLFFKPPESNAKSRSKIIIQREKYNDTTSRFLVVTLLLDYWSSSSFCYWCVDCGNRIGGQSMCIWHLMVGLLCDLFPCKVWN